MGPGWGNGKATAVLLARQGAKVLAIDNNPAAVEETVSIISDEGGVAEARICDVTSSTGFEAALEAGVVRFGQLDIMVNNVGAPHPGGAESMPEDAWETQIALNVRSRDCRELRVWSVMVGKKEVPHGPTERAADT